MSKIVRFYETGGPEVLKIEEAPSKQPGTGEVMLRVQAIGLNRAESMFMHGAYFEPTQLPATLGYEAAGVVIAVGGVPGKFCTRVNETNWYGRSLKWHEGRSIRLSR